MSSSVFNTVKSHHLILCGVAVFSASILSGCSDEEILRCKNLSPDGEGGCAAATDGKFCFAKGDECVTDCGEGWKNPGQKGEECIQIKCQEQNPPECDSDYSAGVGGNCYHQNGQCVTSCGAGYTNPSGDRGECKPNGNPPPDHPSDPVLCGDVDWPNCGSVTEGKCFDFADGERCVCDCETFEGFGNPTNNGDQCIDKRCTSQEPPDCHSDYVDGNCFDKNGECVTECGAGYTSPPNNSTRGKCVPIEQTILCADVEPLNCGDVTEGSCFTKGDECVEDCGKGWENPEVNGENCMELDGEVCGFEYSNSYLIPCSDVEGFDSDVFDDDCVCQQSVGMDMMNGLLPPRSHCPNICAVNYLEILICGGYLVGEYQNFTLMDIAPNLLHVGKGVRVTSSYNRDDPLSVDLSPIKTTTGFVSLNVQLQGGDVKFSKLTEAQSFSMSPFDAGRGYDLDIGTLDIPNLRTVTEEFIIDTGSNNGKIQTIVANLDTVGSTCTLPASVEIDGTMPDDCVCSLCSQQLNHEDCNDQTNVCGFAKLDVVSQCVACKSLDSQDNCEFFSSEENENCQWTESGCQPKNQ